MLFTSMWWMHVRTLVIIITTIIYPWRFTVVLFKILDDS